MNILGIITARGGSKGLPKKNIKLLGGKELIYYTIKIAKKSKLINHLIVSTDDKEIAKVARKYGAEVPFMRPKSLAKDSTTHVPVIQHAVNFFEKKHNIVIDYIASLQPTSPFRTVDDIDKTLEKLIKTGADSSVSLVKIKENHPIKIKKIVEGKVLPYSVKEVDATLRQFLPVAYKRSGAIHSMKRKTIMDKNLLYGKHVVGHVVPEERSIDIDDHLDWIKAKYMLKELKKRGYKF